MTLDELFSHIVATVELERLFPSPRARATGRAMDSTPAGIPYRRCADGILRTDAMRKSWERNGYYDELNKLRGDLRKQHCGDVDPAKVRAGHLCACQR
jgi:hypothetical protein